MWVYVKISRDWCFSLWRPQPEDTPKGCFSFDNSWNSPFVQVWFPYLLRLSQILVKSTWSHNIKLSTSEKVSSWRPHQLPPDCWKSGVVECLMWRTHPGARWYFQWPGMTFEIQKMTGFQQSLRYTGNTYLLTSSQHGLAFECTANLVGQICFGSCQLLWCGGFLGDILKPGILEDFCPVIHSGLLANLFLWLTFKIGPYCFRLLQGVMLQRWQTHGGVNVFCYF